MKKFLAIVMCLAMALSMMTVVSFAAVDSADISMGPVSEYNVDDGILDELSEVNVGDTIAIPVTLSDRNGIKAGSFKITWDATMLSMSDAYNEDDDIYAAYPEVSTLFNQVFSINVEEGSVMVAGSRKNAFSSAGANFSLGYLVFTVLDGAAGKDVTLSFVENGSKTCFNDGDGDKAFTNAAAYSFKVAGEAVTEPIVTATKVDAPEGKDAVCYILQPTGNVKKMGIKCADYVDTFWALADNDGNFATTMAAVQVVGLDDPTIEFAPVYEK